MSKSTSHSISTGLWSHLRCHVMAHAPPGSKGMCVGVQNKHTKPHAKTQVFCRRCNFAGCVAKRCVDIESDDRMSRSFFLFCGVVHDVLRRIRRIRRITTYYDVLRHWVRRQDELRTTYYDVYDVLQRITTYYDVLQRRTTTYYNVRRRTYYNVRRRTTSYYYVVQWRVTTCDDALRRITT